MREEALRKTLKTRVRAHRVFSEPNLGIRPVTQDRTGQVEQWSPERGQNCSTAVHPSSSSRRMAVFLESMDQRWFV